MATNTTVVRSIDNPGWSFTMHNKGGIFGFTLRGPMGVVDSRAGLEGPEMAHHLQKAKATLGRVEASEFVA